ncbi:MAG: NifU family protein [Bacteroidota bacterium]|nr:NifU family protein [Bacteroidota bacterium]
MQQELRPRIEEALNAMRPYLIADGGNVELVDITPEMVVKLRLTGSCSSCDISNMTMKAGLEEGIRRAIPEIQSVESV